MIEPSTSVAARVSRRVGYSHQRFDRRHACVCLAKLVAAIDAMSDTEHPSQAIADLVTIKEVFGRLRGDGILYVGEGNNTAAALALAVSLTPGMRLTLATSEGYGMLPEALATARKLCRESGSVVEERNDLSTLRDGFDVVYTTRWQTMGVPNPIRTGKRNSCPFA